MPSKVRQLTNHNDEGICEYRNCHRDIPDGISIQLCNKHLELAFAAYVITKGLPELTQ